MRCLLYLFIRHKGVIGKRRNYWPTYLKDKMTLIIFVAPRMSRRRSSASERAKELEEINGFVSGKNILITGGAAGLGYAFVNCFLKHGANVSDRRSKYRFYKDQWYSNHR